MARRACTTLCLISATLTAAYTGTAREKPWTPTPDKFFFTAPYKTEPFIETAGFNISRKPANMSELSPGYIFYTLQTFIDSGRAWGPQIVDNEGNLVYYSVGENSIATQAPHVCDYLGTHGTHLCASGVDSLVQGRWLTNKAIIANDYSPAQQPLGAVGNMTAPDGHEFAMLPGGRSYLQPVYLARTLDLKAYGGPVEGVILDACFQEIDVLHGDEVFSWCFMDHFPIEQTYIFLDVEGNKANLTSHLAGKGDEAKPWDAFHVNSLDKDDNGDYLISMRHTDQVLKVAGKRNYKGFQAGAVMWQLGGKNSDFDMLNVTFSRQHHVRFIESTETHTLISMFDNAWEGDNDPSSPYSSGKVVRIDHSTKEAVMVREYVNPDVPLSMAAGNMQTLSNGNQFIGWGWQPRVTEFDARGNILFDASIAAVNGIFSYRTRKYPWVGMPKWPPRLLAYSQTCNPEVSPLKVYVSWNGATEVDTWRFYVSVSTIQGPWIYLSSHIKQGFETEAVLNQGSMTKYLPLIRYVSARAIDSRGRELRRVTAATWVPGEQQRTTDCTDTHCTSPYYEYPQDASALDQCRVRRALLVGPGLVALVLVIAGIEALAHFADRLFAPPRLAAYDQHMTRWRA